MDTVIPILPCPDVKAQATFYQSLGFELTGLYTSPNPYLCLSLGTLELHFYGTRKLKPAENASMCFLKVDDVDQLYQAFVSGLKRHTGKVPRSGIPRISKVRDLKADRRFTLTDTGGNTLFVGTPIKEPGTSFFRDLQNQALAERFATLYDLLYSKEDPAIAAKLLPKLMADSAQLEDLDKAKLLLVASEIQRQLGQLLDDAELNGLLAAHRDESGDWERIRRRYQESLETDS